MSISKKTEKIIAILLIITFLFVFMYLISFEAKHGLHRCSNAECPICQELHAVQGMIKQLIFIPIAIIYGIMIELVVKGVIISESCLISKRNLVTDKVRIDN